MSDEIRDLSGEPFKSHREHHAAKARLEAAAPGLLAALKALVDKTEQSDNIRDYGVSRDDDTMIEARRVISAAEGSASGPRTGQAVVYLLAILSCLGIAGAYAYAVYEGWLR